MLEQWTAQIFQACGVPADHAIEAAATLVRSEVRNYKTHGMTRVVSYVEIRPGEPPSASSPQPAPEAAAAPGGSAAPAGAAPVTSVEVQKL